jgi:hypothetical protein
VIEPIAKIHLFPLFLGPLSSKLLTDAHFTRDRSSSFRLARIVQPSAQCESSANGFEPRAGAGRRQNVANLFDFSLTGESEVSLSAAGTASLSDLASCALSAVADGRASQPRFCAFESPEAREGPQRLQRLD